MSKQEIYLVESGWRGALQALRQARPTAALGGVIAVAVFWVLAIPNGHVSGAALTKSALPIAPLLALAVASSVAQRSRSGGRRSDLALTRLNVLVNTMNAGLLMLTLSAYSLQIGLSFASPDLPLRLAASGFAVGLYLLSAISGVLWCPRSIPSSKADEDQAAVRDVKWLPWIMGAQGSLVGIGVFLGVWMTHNPSAWDDLLMIGLSSLLSMLTVFFGILFLYRTGFLALNPIPPEVQEEFGLRP